MNPMNPDNRYPMPPAPEPERFMLHSVLESIAPDHNHPLANRMHFVSTYRGEAHYKFDHPTLGRLTLRYRYAKDVWRNDPTQDGRKTWNFPDRQTFETQVNSSHGILMVGTHNPADSLTLEAFQKVCGHPEAKTGFYCHLRNRCVTCKPAKQGTSPEHSRITCERKLQLRFLQIKTLLQTDQNTEAMAIIEKLPTFLESVRKALHDILPGWDKILNIPTLKRAA